MLEALGIEAPQIHLRGVEQSDDATASSMPHSPPRRRTLRPGHTTQYFEMFAHRAIYHEGWKAVCPYPGPSLAEAAERGHPFGTPMTEALLDQPRGRGLGAVPPRRRTRPSATTWPPSNPERLAELRDLWWSEAER